MRTSSASLAKWTGIYAGDGGPSAITSNDTAIQFIEADTSLYDTTDAFATTLNDITPAQASAGTLFTPPETVVANPTTKTSPTVYYGGQDLYRTTLPASSSSWTQVTTHGSGCAAGGTCVSAITATADGQYVYVGFTDGNIEVSSDHGLTFTSLRAVALTDHFVTGLAVNPANAKQITATFSYSDTRYVNGLPHVVQYAWSASPATGVWSVITGTGLPAAVSRVIYDNGALIAATDKGVYGTGAPAGSSTSWTPVGSALPNVQVQDLYHSSVGLFAVTHGRGAWKLPGG